MIAHGLLLSGVLAFAGTSLAAHPHTDVDQQVALTLGQDRIAADITIVPSIEAGPNILARLDRDADGVVTEAEGLAFAADVLATVDLQVANTDVALAAVEVSVSDPAALEAGLGTIVISAQTGAGIDLTEMIDVSFEIGFDEFDHDWFVQPYIRGDLFQDSMIDIERLGEGRIIVSIGAGG